MTSNTTSKTLQRLLKRYPDRIEAISDERSTGDGYWLYLTDAWYSPEMECRTLHEDSIGALVEMFHNCIPADQTETEYKITDIEGNVWGYVWASNPDDALTLLEQRIALQPEAFMGELIGPSVQAVSNTRSL